MPRDLFEEAGIAPNQPRDLFAEAGINVSPAKEEAQPSMLSKAVDTLKGLSQKQIDMINNIGFGTEQTLAELPAAGYNLATGAINKLANTHINPVRPNFTQNAPNPEQAEVAGALATAPLLPELGIAKGVSAIPKLAPALARVLGSAGEGAAYTGLFNAANPNHNLTDNMGLNAVIGAGLGGVAAPLIDKSADVLAKFYRGKRAPEEAQKIADTLGDLNMPLGNVVDSPLLKALYNSVKFIPGSGVKASQEKLINQIDENATNLLKSKQGDSTKLTAGADLRDTLNQNYDYHSEIASNKYEELAKALDEANISIPKDGAFLTTAQDILDKEDKMRGFGIDGSLISALKNAVKDNADNYGYSPAHFLRSRLLDKERQASKSNNLAEAKIYGQLANSIETDIENAVNQANIPALYQKRLEANQYFKDNVAPYRDKAITKLLSGDTKEQSIADTLLNPKYEAIVNHLSPEQKQLMQYSFLSKNAADTPNGEVLPLPAALSRYKTLTQNQRNLLFNPEEQQQFDKLADINYMTTPIRQKVTPPLTGFALKGDIDELSKLATAVAATKTGVPVLSLLGGALGANALRKALENPETRNNFVAKMGKAKTPQVPTNALIRALANYNSGGNQ